VLLALHDLEFGQARWSIRATVADLIEFTTPAISPDGRLALVRLTPTDAGQVALISMDSGSVIQMLPAPGLVGMGFADDGKTIWINGYGGLTATYAVHSWPDVPKQ